MDINGKIVSNYNFEKLKKGKQTIELNVKNKLSGGQYTINFNFDGKYSTIEKIVILE